MVGATRPAKLLFTLSARLAITAGIYHTANAYRIAGFKFLYIDAGFSYAAYYFVARHARVYCILPVILHLVDI